MTKENSKVLITAGGGKVGQHVVTQLARKGVPARAGVHSQTRASALRESGIDEFGEPSRCVQGYRHLASARRLSS